MKIGNNKKSDEIEKTKREGNGMTTKWVRMIGGSILSAVIIAIMFLAG
ncbi:hypothetical protein QYG89_16730 [Bacillus sp. B190/17]|uniref:DUF4044 domain-containing protein n=1 Tax=Bacillus lumedeiriae TaxID=3058829 RepID=A0ABW8ICN2_9BACI